MYQSSIFLDAKVNASSKFMLFAETITPIAIVSLGLFLGLFMIVTVTVVKRMRKKNYRYVDKIQLIIIIHSNCGIDLLQANGDT